jgi:hypothetical protein
VTGIRARGSTFHGRDIFAPVAAAIALGTSLSRLGKHTDGIVMLRNIPGASVDGGVIRARGRYIDRFGNVMTDVPVDLVERVFGDVEHVRVSVAGRDAGPLRRTYADGDSGELIAIINSWGTCGSGHERRAGDCLPGERARAVDSLRAQARLTIMRIEPRRECEYEIAREGGMHVPGRVIASSALMDELQSDRVTLEQVMNVAHLRVLPAIRGRCPTHTWATDFPLAVSPPPCRERRCHFAGRRRLRHQLRRASVRAQSHRAELLPRIERIVQRLFETVPCGAHPHQSGTGDLGADEMRRVLRDGAAFAVKRGFGAEVDLEHSEESGAMAHADPAEVSNEAIERGRRQLGSVGSGNHFVEVGCVSRVFDDDAARASVSAADQVTVMIHCGSRGLGHQVCTDFSPRDEPHEVFRIHCPTASSRARPSNPSWAVGTSPP